MLVRVSAILTYGRKYNSRWYAITIMAIMELKIERFSGGGGVGGYSHVRTLYVRRSGPPFQDLLQLHETPISELFSSLRPYVT